MPHILRLCDLPIAVLFMIASIRKATPQGLMGSNLSPTAHRAQESGGPGQGRVGQGGVQSNVCITAAWPALCPSLPATARVSHFLHLRGIGTIKMALPQGNASL